MVVTVVVGALVSTVLGTRASSGLVHEVVGFGAGVPKERRLQQEQEEEERPSSVYHVSSSQGHLYHHP